MKKKSSYRRIWRIFGSLVLLVCCTSAFGRVIYVDADANGANDGTSWENAYNFLQDALDEANTTANTPTTEVWVAQGVYTPDCNSAVPLGSGDREAAFTFLGSSIKVRGGYAGFGQSDPNIRDVNSYETILSGDLVGNDGPDFANYDDNSYHVVLVIWSAIVLDGFTITAGNATGTGGFTISTGLPDGELHVDQAYGAGVFHSYNCRAVITNCVLHKNKANWGAGAYNTGDWSNLTLDDCLFSENAASYGGGMFTGGLQNFLQDRDCEVHLDNCTFKGNSAEFGAGMYNSYNCWTEIADCLFHNNEALWGGGMYNSGDFNQDADGDAEPDYATLTNCVFSDNTAFSGGGMFTGGLRNFIDSESYCMVRLDNCTFERNFADLGGGMYSGEHYRSSPILQDCDFSRNTATFGGGGIYNNDGSLALTGCKFVANSTLVGGGLLGGGGVYSINAKPLTVDNCIFSGNASATVGGAVYVGSCKQGTMNSTTEGICGGSGGGTIKTSTFTGNKAANCGGAICWGVGRAAMANCILRGNIAPQGKEIAIDPHFIGDYDTNDDISYCDVEGGKDGIFYMDPDCRDRDGCGFNDRDPNCFDCNLDWGRSNIDADPCFADPGYWNENGTPDDTTDDFWVDGDYHLKSETGRWEPHSGEWVQDHVTSPCIDAGYPRSTVEPPPHSGYYNMGAYGNTSEASKACFPRSSCGIFLEGDLNGDCVVNAVDMAIMLQSWLENSNYYSSWCYPFLAGDLETDWVFIARDGFTIDVYDLIALAQRWLDHY